MKKIRQLRKILAALGHARARQALRSGVGVAIEHGDIIRTLPVQTVIDIGANTGQFSLLVRKLYPDAKIFAFEPLARPAAVYRKIFAGDPLTTLYQYAVGPIVQTCDMHVSGRDDSSSLLPITEAQVAFAPGTEEIGRETVHIAPLATLLPVADVTGSALLKMDVQGFELQALGGCETMLKCFAYVYVELSFVTLYAGQALAHEVIAWLAERGFRLINIHSPVYGKSGLIVQADFLFKRTLA